MPFAPPPAAYGFCLYVFHCLCVTYLPPAQLQVTCAVRVHLPHHHCRTFTPPSLPHLPPLGLLPQCVRAACRATPPATTPADCCRHCLPRTSAGGRHHTAVHLPPLPGPTHSHHTTTMPAPYTQHACLHWPANAACRLPQRPAYAPTTYLESYLAWMGGCHSDTSPATSPGATHATRLPPATHHCLPVCHLVHSTTTTGSAWVQVWVIPHRYHCVHSPPAGPVIHTGTRTHACTATLPTYRRQYVLILYHHIPAGFYTHLHVDRRMPIPAPLVTILIHTTTCLHLPTTATCHLPFPRLFPAILPACLPAMPATYLPPRYHHHADWVPLPPHTTCGFTYHLPPRLRTGYLPARTRLPACRVLRACCHLGYLLRYTPTCATTAAYHRSGCRPFYCDYRSLGLLPFTTLPTYHCWWVTTTTCTLLPHLLPEDACLPFTTATTCTPRWTCTCGSPACTFCLGLACLADAWSAPLLPALHVNRLVRDACLPATWLPHLSQVVLPATAAHHACHRPRTCLPRLRMPPACTAASLLPLPATAACACLPRSS